MLSCLWLAPCASRSIRRSGMSSPWRSSHLHSIQTATPKARFAKWQIFISSAFPVLSKSTLACVSAKLLLPWASLSFPPPGHNLCLLWPLQTLLCRLKSFQTRFQDYLFLKFLPPVVEFALPFWSPLAVSLTLPCYRSARLNKWGCTLGTRLLAHPDQLWTSDGPLANIH